MAQAGPVLILEFHPSSRSRGRGGFRVFALEALDDDPGVELSSYHGYVRSYLVH